MHPAGTPLPLSLQFDDFNSEFPVASAKPTALVLQQGQIHGRLLAGLLPWIAHGGLVYCIDGGNAFDPYRLTTQTRQAGLEMPDVLERVFVSRAYTCHQLLESIETMLPPLAQKPLPPLALLLHLDHLFHEEDISLEERRYLFDRIVEKVAALHREGLTLLLTLCPNEPNPWAERLKKVAALKTRLDETLFAITGEKDHGTHAADVQLLPGT
jgi:hypothetical protein